MVEIIVFVEGSSDDTNGNLRKGFRILFEQKFSGKMPTFSLCDGKNSAIKKFKNETKVENKFLLIDLDDSKENNEQRLNNYGLGEQIERVKYMIMEMEAWFLSQPNVLTEHYRDQNILSKIPNRNAWEIGHPSKVLEHIIRNNKGRTYHKVKDATALLSKLKLTKLMDDFPDVKELVKSIEQSFH